MFSRRLQQAYREYQGREDVAHMYDVGQILLTPIAERALNDEQLYRQVMRLHMIDGESIPFDELIEQLRTLNDHIRNLGYQK